MKRRGTWVMGFSSGSEARKHMEQAVKVAPLLIVWASREAHGRRKSGLAAYGKRRTWQQDVSGKSRLWEGTV